MNLISQNHQSRFLHKSILKFLNERLSHHFHIKKEAKKKVLQIKNTTCVYFFINIVLYKLKTFCFLLKVSRCHRKKIPIDIPGKEQKKGLT